MKSPPPSTILRVGKYKLSRKQAKEKILMHQLGCLKFEHTEAKVDGSGQLTSTGGEGSHITTDSIVGCGIKIME